jgi:hypothetical protein
MSMTEPAGDAADQADRLVMIMDAEAARAAMSAGHGEAPMDDLGFPLEDLEEILAIEDADDASDDPMHAGGLAPRRWVTAEEAAMHVIAPAGEDDGFFAAESSDLERADPERDPLHGAAGALTAEDETLLGIDPYE